jgi:hypothetical protein
MVSRQRRGDDGMSRAGLEPRHETWEGRMTTKRFALGVFALAVALGVPAVAQADFCRRS